MRGKFFLDRRIFVLYIVTIIILVIGVSYGFKPNLTLNSIVTQILLVDEEVYGETKFDASNLDLRPILDNMIEISNDYVIYIPFWVGGNEVNNVDHIIYDIALTDLEVDCNLLSPYLKWKLVKNGTEISNGSLDYQFDTIENGRLVLTPIQQDLVDYSEDKSLYDKWEFYMWLSDSCQSEKIIDCIDAVSQDNLLGKKVKGRIEVELYAEDKRKLIRKPSSTLNTTTCVLKGANN